MKKIFFTLLLISSTLVSQTTSEFSLQGILRLPAGQAVPDGIYKFTFKIYDRATEGTPLPRDTTAWEETQDLEVKNGIYNALIGEKKPFYKLPFNTTYYVGITVGIGGELVPRIRLTASPYALSLQGVGNKVPNDGPMSFSSNVYHKSNSLDRIRFNNDGSNDINGITAINATDGGPLQLVGTNSSIIEFFPSGKTAGRKSYFGHTSGALNNITIYNEVPNGNINLVTTGTGQIITNSNLNVGGSLNVTKAEGSNVMVKVAELTSGDFNTSHINITGLDGNKHKKYKVYYEIYREGGGSDDYLHIRFNGDAGPNYRFESSLKYFGSGHNYPNHNTANHAFVPIYNGWAKDGWFIGEFTVFANTGGIATGYQRNVYGTANFLGNNHNPAHGIWSGYWTNKNDNITYIQFAANRTFHAGTITVYAIP